jgi:type I restriction enzyme S subunit
VSPIYTVFSCSERIEPNYLYRVLKSPELISKYKLHEQASVDRRGAVHYREFSKIQLIIPPLAEQRRIAEILDTMDEAIRSTERLIAKLEQGRRGILHHLLTYGIDDNGHVRDIHKPSSQFTDSVLGRYPSEWRLRSFGALARYLNGYAFKPEDWVETGYPIIRIQNLNGSSNFNYYDGPVHPNWLILPGDLLFAWSGTRDSSFGPTIWRGPQGVLNQHIFKVHENGSIVTRAFLYLLLRYCLERITSSAHGFKDSFVHVKRSELTSVPVAVPPINEQEEILRITDSEDRLIAAESFKLERLRLLKTGLIDDLLTGRVRVGASG